MSTTVNEIQIELNTILGDSSTDRISAAERLQFVNQAVGWLLTEIDNDHSIRTYTLDYFDTINYYKLNDDISDVFEGNALRRIVSEVSGNPDLTRKDAREVAQDITTNSMESSYAPERKDGDLYLAINHASKYVALQVTSFDSLTANGGTWEADTTNSDATNVAISDVDGTNGKLGCLTFDVDVSQSGNDKATIQNTELTSEDLSDEKDLSSWLLEVKFPDVTYISSVTFYWGSDSSNYYSVTQTTDIHGGAFVADWNTLKFDWLGSTATGTPVDTAIDFMRIDINYTSSQTDDTSFKLDDLRLVRAEKLTFHYSSWDVGTDSSGTQLKKFTATTDIPYFSGQYDNYLYPVAHKAAALAYKSLRLYNESKEHEIEALRELAKIKKIIPKSRPSELKSFKVRGVNLSGRVRVRR